MTPNEYQELAMRTNDGCHIGRLKAACQEDVPDFGQPSSGTRYADLICGALGLTGESGEVADLIKKSIFHGDKLSYSTELKEELGDVLWYIALMCNALNISMEEVMELNIEKLKKRYPKGFSEEASRSRLERS